MTTPGPAPRFPESAQAQARRLEERMKQIAPHGLVSGPNSDRIALSDLQPALSKSISASTEATETADASTAQTRRKRVSLFEPGTDAVARATAERIIDGAVGSIRDVTEGGGSLAGASQEKLFEIQSVVDALRRVSWFVENDDYRVQIRPIDDGLDAFWSRTFEEERGRVGKVCKSVAVITIDGMPFGTGWLAARDILITNAHVACQMGRRIPGRSPSGSGERWRLTRGRAFAAAFRYEHGNLDRADEHRQVEICDILHVETSQHPDLAVLQLKPPKAFDMPEPLGIDIGADTNGSCKAGARIYAVGHPIKDLQGDADNVTMTFGQLDGAKRFSPGKVIDMLDTDTLAHDCSTTNGSSGSPIVAMGSVAPVALHYYGRPGVRNEAVLFSAWAQHPAIQAVLSGRWGSSPEPGAPY